MFQWIITRDLTEHDGNPECAVHRGNFHGDPATLPYAFRLYDDDGHLYYEGKSSDRNSQRAFDPLDWAQPYAGCTRIDYLRENGRWETL